MVKTAKMIAIDKTLVAEIKKEKKKKRSVNQGLGSR
jgi:hypothetical protein